MQLVIDFKKFDDLCDQLEVMLIEMKKAKYSVPMMVIKDKVEVYESPIEKVSERVPEPSLKDAQEKAFDGEQISDEELRAAAHKASLKDKAAVKELVQKIGVTAVSQVPPDMRRDFLDELTNIAS